MNISDNDLKQVQDLLSLDFPSAIEIKKDEIANALWLIAIEQLESRLILANAITDGKLWNSPRAPFRAPSNKEPITVTGLQQCAQYLDSFIASQSSKKDSKFFPIQLKLIFEKVLRFKARLTFQPGYRLLFDYAANAITKGSPSTFPKVTILPNSDEDARRWYKYYAQYKALMSLVDFEGDMIKNIGFKNNWLKDDEGIAIALISYCFHSSNFKNMAKVHRFSSSALESNPSLRVIHSAIKAFL